VIWLVNFGGIAVFFLICEPNVETFAVAVMVLVGVNLAIAFPLTPGAMGIFQAVCVTILAGQDVPFERAFAEGVMLQFAIVFLSVLAAIPIVVSCGIGWIQIRRTVMGRDLPGPIETI
jgi:phosphatidylinositol alpha-mannosyltransferase